MDYYCVNHTQEKAVGLCGTCHRPACYRCSLNVNDALFCSLECFNKLSPPSAMDVPAMPPEAAVPAGVLLEDAALDEYSDVMAGLTDRSEVVMPAAAADEPSVILTSDQALDPTTILGMNPGPSRDGSTLILIPGTRRAVMSSSCYFHPDTSAIVLCSKCRSPICSICAKETPEGLTCTPECGPADPVGDRERSNTVMFNIGLGAAILLVLVGGIFLLNAARPPEPIIALKRPPVAAPALPERKADPPAPEPPPPVEPPRPALSRVEEPEPVRVELPPAKVEPPAPVKVEVPKPAPPPPVVVVPPKAEPVARIVPVIAVLPPPPPPPVPEPSQLELDLQWAAALLREATPLLGEVADAMHPEWKRDIDLVALASKLTTADVKLKQAREIYAFRRKNAPDPELLGRRIDAITEVLEGVQAGFEHIRERDRVAGKWRR